MAISKGQRFDIFKRDGFTCQYCGCRPPEVVLEVDHVHPESKGGSSDPLNLITACFPCNNGKRAKVLSDTKPKPDADIEFLAIQQEMGELRRYLASKEDRDLLIADAILSLTELWNDEIGTWSPPAETQFKTWLRSNSPEEIAESIEITGVKYQNYWIEHSKLGAVKYVCGILKNKRQDREDA